MKGIALLILSSTLVLTGCGDEEEKSSADAAKVPEDARVSIEVSGNHEGTFVSRGSIFCGNTGMPDAPEYFELYAMRPPEKFNLRFPRTMSAGDHAVSGTSDPESTDLPAGTAFFYYTDPQGVRYSRVENGTLQLTTVPEAPGENLTGFIRASAASDAGETVDLEITMHVKAGSQTFDECD